MNRKRKYLEQGIFLSIFLVFVFGDPSDKISQYSPLFIFLFATIFYTISNINKVKLSQFDFIPFILLLLWLYGVIIGLFNQNKNVFINNIGILYFTSYYYFKYSSTTALEYINIINFVSVIALLSNVYLIIDNQNFLLNLALGQRALLSHSSIIPILLFPLVVYNIFYSKSKFIKIKVLNLLILIPIILISILLTASKGIYLFVIFTIISLAIIFFKRSTSVNIVLIILVAFGINIFQKDDTLTIFGNNDISNQNRYSQADAVIDELTIFGKGWGATFSSPDLDRDENGYSIELSYPNLFHKIGIFSCIYFIIYLFIIFKGLKRLSFNNFVNNKEGLYVIGSIYYLFMALGNPVLFSPINVVLTSLSLKVINSKT